MMTKREHARRRFVLLGAVLATSLGAASASAEILEEVVAQASRAEVVDDRARFEATMEAYAEGVDAALKSAMRKDLTEMARPRLRVALATLNHRG